MQWIGEVDYWKGSYTYAKLHLGTEREPRAWAKSRKVSCCSYLLESAMAGTENDPISVRDSSLTRHFDTSPVGGDKYK